MGTFLIRLLDIEIGCRRYWEEGAFLFGVWRKDGLWKVLGEVGVSIQVFREEDFLGRC